MNRRQVDPARCPLCGEANQCAMAEGKQNCWCYERHIPDAVLARVPREAQRLACVCSRCAAADGESLEPQEEARPKGPEPCRKERKPHG